MTYAICVFFLSSISVSHRSVYYHDMYHHHPPPPSPAYSGSRSSTKSLYTVEELFPIYGHPGQAYAWHAYHVHEWTKQIQLHTQLLKQIATICAQYAGMDICTAACHVMSCHVMSLNETSGHAVYRINMNDHLVLHFPTLSLSYMCLLLILLLLEPSSLHRCWLIRDEDWNARYMDPLCTYSFIPRHPPHAILSQRGGFGYLLPSESHSICQHCMQRMPLYIQLRLSDMPQDAAIGYALADIPI